MYIPKYFKINDREVMYKFIEENSFATLFSQHNGKSYATHLPLILDKENQMLYGHFAIQNSQWKDAANQEALAVFHGPHCYISPSWYETTTAVPTWNYIAIHVYGQITVIDDNQELIDSLRNMVLKYEDPNSSYKFEEVSPNYMNGLKKGIIGFKIQINKIEGKWKLNQNDSLNRQELVIQKLKEIPSENHKLIAKFMKENLQSNNKSLS